MKKFVYTALVAYIVGYLVALLASHLPPPLGQNLLSIYLLPFLCAGFTALAMNPRPGNTDPSSSNIAAVRVSIMILMALATALFVALFFVAQARAD